MSFRKFDCGRNLIVRAKHDSDIIKFVTDVAKENGITAATFTAIGALKNAKLGFYDQEKHEYLENTLPVPQEIASCPARHKFSRKRRKTKNILSLRLRLSALLL
jgi:predicted DNA-binding protein with PD1-like motif